jgi:citrate lyase subunit beta / citryl-CoA lyase
MTSTTASSLAQPRRSMLYMPASNARVLDKAKTLAADTLIFDLEDAVAPEAKAEARKAAVAAVNSRAYGRREILIRANGIGTPWFKDDLAAIAMSSADGLILPKIDGPEDLRRVDAVLSAEGASNRLKTWAMMETPRGILVAEAIATSTPRLAGFLMGTADLSKDLHCAHPADRAPMLYALQHCILVARAYGLAVVDGIHADIDDNAGFLAACRQGRDLGFDGKSLIHPKQIEIANASFAPSADEVAHARRLVAAHAEAAAKGHAVMLLNGQLVEVLHVTQAERLLAQAALIAELEA